MVKVKNSDEKPSASSLWALGASCRVIRRSIVLAWLKQPKRPLRHRRHTKLHVDRGKRGTRNRPPSWISSSTSCMHHQYPVPQITGTKCLSKSSAISTFYCIYSWLFWHFPMLYPAGRWCLTTTDIRSLSGNNFVQHCTPWWWDDRYVWIIFPFLLRIDMQSCNDVPDVPHILLLFAMSDFPIGSINLQFRKYMRCVCILSRPTWLVCDLQFEARLRNICCT